MIYAVNLQIFDRYRIMKGVKKQGLTRDYDVLYILIRIKWFVILYVDYIGEAMEILKGK